MRGLFSCGSRKCVKCVDFFHAGGILRSRWTEILKCPVLGASQQRPWLPSNVRASLRTVPAPRPVHRRFVLPFCRPLGSLRASGLGVRFPINAPGKNKFSRLSGWFVSSLPIAIQPVLTDQGINQRLAFLTSTATHLKNIALPTMASSGTMRGTPKGRGTVPAFTNSPASSIPRPAFESHPSGSQSEAGGSTMSASRQKQSKRDEVCLTHLLSSVAGHN